MRIAAEHYPRIQQIWYETSDKDLRFKLKEELLKFTISELEQMELYIWAQLTFGEKITDRTTGKAIHTIIEEILVEMRAHKDG